jgi:hypothetical protein
MLMRYNPESRTDNVYHKDIADISVTYASL